MSREPYRGEPSRGEPVGGCWEGRRGALLGVAAPSKWRVSLPLASAGATRPPETPAGNTRRDARPETPSDVTRRLAAPRHALTTTRRQPHNAEPPLRGPRGAPRCGQPSARRGPPPCAASLSRSREVPPSRASRRHATPRDVPRRPATPRPRHAMSAVFECARLVTRGACVSEACRCSG